MCVMTTVFPANGCASCSFQPAAVLRVQLRRVAGAQEARRLATRTDVLVVGHVGLRRVKRFFLALGTEQQKIRPQRDAEEAYSIDCHGVAVEQADVGAVRIRAGAGIAHGVLHVFELVAIAFVIAVHVQHGQGAEGARGPGDGMVACSDVAGQDHHVGAAGGKVDGGCVFTPDFQVQVGQDQQTHGSGRGKAHGRSMGLYRSASRSARLLDRARLATLPYGIDYHTLIPGAACRLSSFPRPC